MRVIEARAKYIDKEGLSIEQLIERVGRVCYKSENKIEDGSAIKFVKSMVKSTHTAMLEHSNVILLISQELYAELIKATAEMWNLRLQFTNKNIAIVSGSLTAWRNVYDYFDSGQKFYFHPIFGTLMAVADYLFPDVLYAEHQNGSPDALIITESALKEILYYYPDEIMKHVTHTVLFTCDRGVSHELVRHRIASFAQESTRYCNYSRDKYNNELTYIQPDAFFADENEMYKSEYYSKWKEECLNAEDKYISLIELGVPTDMARGVLNNSLKTDIVVTATEKEWQHIINVRLKGTTGRVHLQMKQIMSLIKHDLSNHSNNRINVQINDNVEVNNE